MKNTENNLWIADSSCFIIRKKDNFIMGENIYLGDADSIENYKDQEYTEESYVKFYHDLGLLTPIELKEGKMLKEVVNTIDSSLN